MKQLHVRLLVLLGVLSVSFAAILIKLSDATALHNAFFRMFFSTLILLPMAWRSRDDWRHIDRQSFLLMGLSGVCLGFHFFTWFVSLDHTSIANSMVLITLSPLFTISGSALLYKTPFEKKEIIITLTAIAGSVIMAFHTGRFEAGEFFGNAMAVLGASLIAVYLLIGRRLRQSVSTTLYTFMVYGFASLTLGILTAFDSTPLLAHPPKDWLIFVLLAVFPTLLGHSLFSYALKYVKAAYISTVVLLEPVLTILLAALIFRIYPDARQVLGGMIILAALVFYTAGEKD